MRFKMGNVDCTYLDAADGREQLKQFVVNTAAANEAAQ